MLRLHPRSFTLSRIVGPSEMTRPRTHQGPTMHFHHVSHSSSLVFQRLTVCIASSAMQDSCSTQECIRALNHCRGNQSNMRGDGIKIARYGGRFLQIRVFEDRSAIKTI